eukprot:jgi/Botrbrau1/13293/Bobra.27_2s0013.1
MSAMDTGDGPSSSYQHRGGNRGQRQYNNQRGSYSGRGRGGGGGFYNGYQQDFYYQPPTRGGRQYESNQNGYNRSFGYQSNGQGAQWGGRGRQVEYRGRSTNYWGRGGQRNPRPAPGRGPPPRFDEPDDIEFVRLLRGHTKQVTAAVLDPSGQTLYTGSQDGTVRCWSTTTAQCTSVVNVGGEVDSLLYMSGFLFVGLHLAPPGQEGIIKVYNTSTSAESELRGHTGAVLCLAAAEGLLFSGGQDKSIKVWKYDNDSQTFNPLVELTEHTAPVQSLMVISNLLFSADWSGCVKAWDMSTGKCVQTILRAHDTVIMGMLSWENCLLTSALDGNVRVWVPTENPVEGQVVDPTPAYQHPVEDEFEMQGKRRNQEFGGVLALMGSVDTANRPVLMVSHSDDNIVRLYDLPSFSDRGHLPGVVKGRALTAAGRVLISGDQKGVVKMWQWKTEAMPLN